MNIGNAALLPTDEYEELASFVEFKYYRTLRYDFWKFCVYMDGFFLRRKKILKPIAKALMRVEAGEIHRLGISLPPRTGKSYIVTMFSVWMLGNNPTGCVMRNCSTYTLFKKFSYDARKIIRSDKYRKVFECATLSDDRANIDSWALTLSKEAAYIGNGVGGQINGVGCNLVGIADDLVKGVEQAMSEDALEKIWRWHGADHLSRIEGDTPEIIVSTRWSNRDPTGKLKQLHKFDEIIEVPAFVDDKSFCDDVISTNKLTEKKELTDESIFQAEYMQNPIELTGLLYPRDELRFFKLKELKGKGEYISVVDTADTGTDFTCGIVAKLIDRNAYVIDVVFTQEDMSITEGLITGMLLDYNVSLCKIESNSGGRSFGRRVQELLVNAKSKCEVQLKATTINKTTRMLMRTSIVKKYVFLRNDEINLHYRKFLDQLCTTFKKESSNRHDDAADSITMLAEMIQFNTQFNW